MSRTALYLRISRDSDKIGRGVARQLAECQALAKRDGLDIVAQFEDNDVSASRFAKKGRPAFTEMMERAEAGEFNTLLAWDLDRLIRRPDDGERVIKLNERASVNVRTVFDTVDLSSPNGVMFLRIKNAVSAQESDLKAKRVQAAHRQRLAEGKPISGRTPFGWKKGGLELEPAEADLIRAGVAHVLDGGSMSSLQRAWNDAGELGPSGKPWTVQAVKKVLRRWRNAGLVEHKGEVLDVPSQIQPIVSREDLEAVRLRLQLQPDAAGRPVAKSWLSGVLSCGVCGARMLPRKSFYQCSTSTERTRAADTERHVAISKPIAENRVRNQVFMVANMVKPEAPEVAQVREAEAGLTAALQERAEVTELLLVAGVDRKVIQKRLTDIASRIEALEAQRLRHRTASSEAARLAKLLDGTVGGALSAFPEWRAWFDGLSVDEKRDLSRTLGTITVEKGGRGWRRIKFREIETQLL